MVVGDFSTFLWTGGSGSDDSSIAAELFHEFLRLLFRSALSSDLVRSRFHLKSNNET